MRQMFHVKHGVDAPPTTCIRSEIDASPQLPIAGNGCSVARSIEVTMVGTVRSIEITKVSYHAWQLKSKHGVDAPPTTCIRSPKRKRLSLRN